MNTIAAAGAGEAPALELVTDGPARAAWREHIAVRLAYGLACALVAVLVPGEWERFCVPTAAPPRLVVREAEPAPPPGPAPVPVAA